MDRHIQTIEAGDERRRYISIPPEEIKNEVPFRMQISPQLDRLLDLYAEQFRYSVGGDGSPWLFANRNGEKRSTVAFSRQICKFIYERTGIEMHIHLFRHLAAKLHLEQNPSDIESARRFLGHKTSATTTRNYVESRPEAALRRYAETISQLMPQSDINP